MNKHPKQKIIDAAAHLIAQKGFAGVGVREIAKKAGVNISMISYYYGGKVGLLKAIISEHYGCLNNIFDELSKEILLPEDKFRLYIRKLVKHFTEKEYISKVAIFELPFDIPEIASFKIDILSRNMKRMRETIDLCLEMPSQKKHTIIGPAFITMLFSNFLFGPMIKRAFKVKFDSAFYDEYSDTLADLYLVGVKGIAKRQIANNK